MKDRTTEKKKEKKKQNKTNFEVYDKRRKTKDRRRIEQMLHDAVN